MRIQHAFKSSCVVAAFAIATNAVAAGASCRVAVDYSLDATTVESYRKDFVVEPGVDFVDDFSTQTRFKEFSASATSDGDETVVSINYFSDVDTFDTISLDAHVTIRGNRKTDSTSGRHTFSTSLGIAGNHETTYSLACRRK